MLEYAIAIGAGPFPFDMLRHDHCFPADKKSSQEMGHPHYNHDRVVIVAKEQRGGWNPRLWDQVGWTLIVYRGRGFKRFEDAQYTAEIARKECKSA